MIVLSSRHAGPLAALLALVALPVLYHAVVRPQADDCAAPDALALERFAGLELGEVFATLSVPSDGGPATHGKLLTKRRWRTGPLWTVVRSWHLGDSYFRPPGLFSFDSLLDTDRVRVVESATGPLPVHVRRVGNDELTNTAAYVYVFGGEPVARPFAASLRRAWQQLRDGTLPLTVMLVEGDIATARVERGEAELVDWVRAAWSHYRAVCRS